MKFGYLKGHGRHFWKSHNFEKEIAFCERTYVVSPLSDKKKVDCNTYFNIKGFNFYYELGN